MLSALYRMKKKVLINKMLLQNANMIKLLFLKFIFRNDIR